VRISCGVGMECFVRREIAPSFFGAGVGGVDREETLIAVEVVVWIKGSGS